MEQNDDIFFELMQRMYRDRQKKHCETSLAPIEFFTLMAITAIMKMKMGEMTSAWTKEMKKTLESAQDQTEDGATVGELVKLFGASMSSVSRKVTELEKKGYVERIPSQKDRRVIYLRPTEAGTAVWEKERKKQIALKNYIAGELGEDKYLELLRLANQAFDLKEQFYAEFKDNDNNE